MLPKSRSVFRTAFHLLLAGVLAVAPVTVASAAAPALQLVGAGAAETVDLSIDELAAMPQYDMATENEFADGKVTYRGPRVEEVLARLGLDKLDSVRFVAANDYYVDIPTEDLVKYHAILAMQADGKALTRREKGPLWLMYPISDYPALQDPIYMRRLIWQVVRIEAQ